MLKEILMTDVRVSVTRPLTPHLQTYRWTLWWGSYYLFDLQKKTSFIQWAVDQGLTVFAISWVNLDARHSEKDFENYWLEGPYAALQAMEKTTGERSSHIVSYGLGGTLTPI
jgi:polyhydroxyalkanoate synthase subunit PhaC